MAMNFKDNVSFEGTVNVPAPAQNTHAATKAYVDAKAIPVQEGTDPATATNNTFFYDTDDTGVYYQPEVPVGTIVMFGGSVAPAGWHLCDGSAHNSPTLQQVLGSANVPDLRDRFIVGAGSSYAVGNTGGAPTVTLGVNEMPYHDHGDGNRSGWTNTSGWHGHDADAVGDHNHGLVVQTNTTTSGSGRRVTGGSGTIGDATANGGGHDHNINGSGNHEHNVHLNAQGGGAAHENRPPYYALTYIIRKSY